VDHGSGARNPRPGSNYNNKFITIILRLDVEGQKFYHEGGLPYRETHPIIPGKYPHKNSNLDQTRKE
jgi:hypothetical protein